jgi:hypothetical protein
MTVSQYLDLAYAVVVDERVRRGASLYEALDDTADLAAGGGEVVFRTGAASNTTQAVRAAPPPEQGIGGPGQPATAADLANVEAMRLLTGGMSNVQGGFG